MSRRYSERDSNLERIPLASIASVVPTLLHTRWPKLVELRLYNNESVMPVVVLPDLADRRTVSYLVCFLPAHQEYVSFQPIRLIQLPG